MFKVARVTFVFSLLLAVAALAATKDSPKDSSKSGLSSGDQKFIKEAAQGGMMEVELGKVASDKASNDAVKQFGKRMVDDHSKANDELMTLAKNKNVQLSNTVEGKHKKTLDKLSKESGDKFDRDYMNDMVSDHKNDVAAFQRAADKAQDPDVKSFAAKTLPTLKAHLQLAQDTQKSLKKSNTAKNTNTSKTTDANKSAK